MDKEKRYSYVPDYEKNIFCDKANNNVSDLVFHDKWQTYLKFKKFFKREAILIEDKESLHRQNTIDFLKNHPKFILKPINAATGSGIEIIASQSYEDAVSKLYPKLVNRQAYILEELILQSAELADFHPSSVNTIRISTFRYSSSEVEILYPFIKFGTGGNYVDNGGKGGIICAIDLDSGRIIAVIDESPNHYTHHPNTGKELIGFKVPHWEEAITLAKELAEIIPDVRYVGWDLALTDNGWVMVEGNEKGMFIGFQLLTHTGFRHHFNQICKKSNIKL